MSDDKWISKSPENLPDFIISGGMKCATTTIHAILAKHPDVYMPNGELHMFDMDDVFEHPQFNYYDSQNDIWYSKLNSFDTKWDEYHAKFKVNGFQIKGEDSTGYLSSKKAFRRIALQKKPIKIIVMLRHPTSRAYSNYYHLLRNGKSLFSFEDTIQYLPHTILSRSMYKQHIENLYKYIPRERVKVVIFEDFVKDNKLCIHLIGKYLISEYQI